MSIKYIRDTYGVPAYRGARVAYRPGKLSIDPRFGTIMSADGAYLRIRFDGDARTFPAPFHPEWGLTYLSSAPREEA